MSHHEFERKGVSVDSTKLYLIVGLGNPGFEYKHTRHNIGFTIVYLWSRDLRVRLTGRRFRSRHVRARFKGKEILLLCPQTYMNQSGRSVRACVSHYGLNDERILVIHDDLDLPLGRIRVIRNGGAGGHKGVLSIIEHLNSPRFPRIKIGIGRPRCGEDVEDYVLSPFYSDETDKVREIAKLSIYACELFVSEGIESAMRHINCQNLAHN